MMKKIIITSFLLITFILCNAQSKNIDKNKMYADFDFLINKIEKLSPRLKFIKELTNYSVLDTIKSFRKEIDTTTNYFSFRKLIRKTVATINDGHSYAIGYPEFINMYKNIKLNIPIHYINGKYYIVREFEYKNKTYPVGSILIKVNKKPVGEIILASVPHLRGISSPDGEWNNNNFSNWNFFTFKIDVNNKCFYSDKFLFADNLVEKGNIELSFVLPDNTTNNDTFYYNENVNLKPKLSTYKDSNKVEYWPEQKVLYIRISDMDDSRKCRKFYKTKIIGEGKGNEIKKVIFDVKDNMGGDFFLWKFLYELLIKEPISLRYSVYGNNPKNLTKQYKRWHRMENNITDSIKFDGSIFYRYDTDSSGYHFPFFHLLKPCKESLKLDCKFITVGNENIFSATGEALQISNFNSNDNCISIGRPTGEFVGNLFDAIIFKLPNSKIKICIDPTIDLNNVKEVKDAMHDKYEYEIPHTIKEWQDKYNYNGNIWDKDFLINYDPFIKKALEL